jgi:predicted RecA/RadA family phage recombinase
MAKNYRSPGEVVVVTAAAARTSGSLVRESTFVGIAQTTAATGTRYGLMIVGEHEIPFVTGAVKGSQVSISTDGNNTVAVAAPGTALGNGTVYVGRVTGVLGDPNSHDATQTSFPAPGFMTVKLSGTSTI